MKKILTLFAMLLFSITIIKAQSPENSITIQPKVVEAIAPEYPRAAESARTEGRVVINTRVNEAGFVTSVKVLRASKLFVKASIEAAKKWRFNELKGINTRAIDLEFIFRITQRIAECGVIFMPPNQIEIATLDHSKFSETYNARYEGNQEQPTVTKSFSPPYPQIARAAKAHGKVEVEVKINKQGKVISATAISGHVLLKAGVLAAAKNWEFSWNDNIEERLVTLTFIFREADKKEDEKISFISPYQIEIVASPPKIETNYITKQD